ncbi:hypothetical protein F0223_04310 [Vibrio coralliilyticus]|uniref:hypothetical protein n=1 Tax=Vibrio TaxID=662 RepID=UPI000503F8D0|nr:MULTISPECIES: hypothetical protein [Vibrio]KFI12890.1 hypothetical protein IX95_08020 [Vibrio sp. B183]NOI17447.1 hypothetical protein [Vibrio coralliilyticus]
MSKHSLLFKEQLLTTSTKGTECRVNIPRVWDEVRLETITGEELLASVTMSDEKNSILNCCVLGSKPAYIPDSLDNISFGKVRFIYSQGKGLNPETKRTVSELDQLIEVIGALLNDTSFKNSSVEEMLSVVRVVCNGCNSSLEYVAPNVEHTLDLSSEYLLKLLQEFIDGHQEEDIVK